MNRGLTDDRKRSELVDALFDAAEKFDKADFGRKQPVVYIKPFTVKMRRRVDGTPSFGVIDANGELFHDYKASVFDDKHEAQVFADELNKEKGQ